MVSLSYNSNRSKVMKGYISQLKKEHLDFLVKLSPAKAFNLLKDNEPKLPEMLTDLFQRAYMNGGLDVLTDNLLQSQDPRQSLHTILNKAFMDGALVAFLVDYIGQTNFHKGAEAANKVIAEMKKRLSEMSIDDDEEDDADSLEELEKKHNDDVI